MGQKYAYAIGRFCTLRNICWAYINENGKKGVAFGFNPVNTTISMERIADPKLSAPGVHKRLPIQALAQFVARKCKLGLACDTEASQVQRGQWHRLKLHRKSGTKIPNCLSDLREIKDGWRLISPIRFDQKTTKHWAPFVKLGQCYLLSICFHYNRIRSI